MPDLPGLSFLSSKVGNRIEARVLINGEVVGHGTYEICADGP